MTRIWAVAGVVALATGALAAGAVNKNKDVPPMDRSIGEILDKLDELKLADHTAVIFLSDNGGHPQETRNTPLGGGKSMLYEGGIRVPMIVRWPGRTTPGSVCNISCDIAEDISEKHDLTQQRPELARAMLVQLTDWLRTNCNPAYLPTPNPRFDPNGPLPYGPYVPLEKLKDKLTRAQPATQTGMEE